MCFSTMRTDLCGHMTEGEAPFLTAFRLYWFIVLGKNSSNRVGDTNSQIECQCTKFIQKFTQNHGQIESGGNSCLTDDICKIFYVHKITWRNLAHLTCFIGKCLCARAQTLIALSTHWIIFVLRCISLFGVCLYFLSFSLSLSLSVVDVGKFFMGWYTDW